MDTRDSDSPSPLELEQAVDEICDRFERAWQAGEIPRLEDFATQVSSAARRQLLAELLAIELEYARNGSERALSAKDILAQHPALAVELREPLAALLRRPAASGKSAHADDGGSTIATLRPSGSEGLHIRCPHCQVALELLADSPLDKINCHSCGSNFSLVGGGDDSAESVAPRQVGRFRLVERIGVGGFGSVWRAHDADLDRAVAVKIPRKGQLTSTEMELFFREARAAAQLRHPNIVPVHEVGRDGDTIFIVSDLILGESLANWLREQAPSTRDMTVLLAKVADALHYAHEQGVVHRDFKPSNVMIDQAGEPHLMDFGLAKREAGEVTMTIDGHIVGTPAYMSPEQATGGASWVDRRTDVYSLGVVLFEVLTGELPFRGNAQMQIRERLVADPPDPRTLNQKSPVDLATICLKCLEREPNRRYSTALEASDELRRYLRGEPILARPISRTGRLLRWARRNPAPATAAVLAIVLAIAGPITAITIARQRNKIAGKLDEIARLVTTEGGKLKESNEARQNLEAKVRDLLGIKSQEWTSDTELNRMLMEDLLKERRDALTSALAGDAVSRESKARGHLALAYLLAGLNERDAARTQAQAAISELNELAAAHPESLRWGIGLGECYQLLDQLDDTTNTSLPEKEIAVLTHTRKLLQQAADAKNPQLLKAIAEQSAKWPIDPDELYLLACGLTDRPATLAEPQPLPTKAPSD
ncbi:MAG: serine/threonine-protein kinase [Pirellulales bacterium]